VLTDADDRLIFRAVDGVDLCSRELRLGAPRQPTERGEDATLGASGPEGTSAEASTLPGPTPVVLVPDLAAGDHRGLPNLSDNKTERMGQVGPCQPIGKPSRIPTTPFGCVRRPAAAKAG